MIEMVKADRPDDDDAMLNGYCNRYSVAVVSPFIFFLPLAGTLLLLSFVFR